MYKLCVPAADKPQKDRVTLSVNISTVNNIILNQNVSYILLHSGTYDMSAPVLLCSCCCCSPPWYLCIYILSPPLVCPWQIQLTSRDLVKGVENPPRCHSSSVILVQFLPPMYVLTTPITAVRTAVVAVFGRTTIPQPPLFRTAPRTFGVSYGG